MIVIAADYAVAKQLRDDLAAARIDAHMTDDPDVLKAAARQPIVMITGGIVGPIMQSSDGRDQEIRRAARANGGDTFEVSLADLQARPDAIMKHLILFASANLLAAEPTPQR